MSKQVENQQFVTKRPQVGDTFIFRGIKLVADRTALGMCTGCVGESFRDSCTALPSCSGIVWKKATIQETDTGYRIPEPESSPDQADQASDLDNNEQGWN